MASLTRGLPWGRDYDGQPVNTSQQMDVDEYFNMLFDKLENCLKGTSQERILQDCFGGKFVNQIICKEPVTVGDKVMRRVCLWIQNSRRGGGGSGGANPFLTTRRFTLWTIRTNPRGKRSSSPFSSR